MSATKTAVVTTGNVQTTVDLYITTCPSCGIIHAIPQDLKVRRREQGGDVYCPNGHVWIFKTKEVDVQRKRADSLAERLKWAETGRQAARDQAAAAERSAAAYRGHLTRLKRSVAKGVCPVPRCRRTFSNVLAHIQGQHPDWAHEHPEALT
ncbi:MAG: hypothetical protein ACOH10_15325 [Rhodoglobus sp.]